MKPSSPSLQSPRTTLKRLADRGRYDQATVHAVLDAGLLCHVGFVVDGQPHVLPMVYGRVDDRLYLHGAVGNRMLRSIARDGAACVTVTVLDGLVLSRSAFHSSVNFRSVVLLGRPEVVEDTDEVDRALEAIVDHITPGRWSELRWPNAIERKRTIVLRLPISEASAKVRTGGPIEDPDDLGGPHWGGHVPLRLVAGDAIADGDVPPGRAVPGSVARLPERLSR